MDMPPEVILTFTIGGIVLQMLLLILVYRLGYVNGKRHIIRIYRSNPATELPRNHWSE